MPESDGTATARERVSRRHWGIGDHSKTVAEAEAEQAARHMAVGGDRPGVIHMDPATSDGRHILVTAPGPGKPGNDDCSRGLTGGHPAPGSVAETAVGFGVECDAFAGQVGVGAAAAAWTAQAPGHR